MNIVKSCVHGSIKKDVRHLADDNQNISSKQSEKRHNDLRTSGCDKITLIIYEDSAPQHFNCLVSFRVHTDKERTEILVLNGGIQM